MRKRRIRIALSIIVGLCCVAVIVYLRRSSSHERHVSIAEIVRAINSGEIDSLVLGDSSIIAVTASSQSMIAMKELGSDGVNLLINLGADRRRLSVIRDVRYVPNSVWSRTSSRFVNFTAFWLPIIGILVILTIVLNRSIQARKKKEKTGVVPAVALEVALVTPPTTPVPAPPEPFDIPTPPAADQETIPSELPGDAPSIRWQEIVGHDEAKLTLQNCARLLKSPAPLISVGGIPKKGFLLAGPSRTGKSNLALALAAELDARVFQTVGSTYFGCSDVAGVEKIREVFAKARSVPHAVVLIEQLDVLGKRRSNNWGGPSGAINQLIAEFDDFGENTNIVVIGTVERRDVIDEALLEDGRFDHTINVHLPTERERCDLIVQHAAGKLFDASWDDAAHQRLAAQAEGMDGQSIISIINGAAYRAALREASTIGLEDIQEALSAESCRTRLVTQPKETQENDASGSQRYEDRFRESISMIVDDESPKVTWAQIAGATEAKKALQEHARYLREPEALARLGVRPRRGVMLVGPPGTGKTMLARAAATDLGARFFSVSGATFVDMFVGIGAARIRHLFAQAKAVPAAVIFIDEIDAVGRRRANRQYGAVEYDHALNQLLIEIDGFEKNSSTLIIGATNRLDVLDPALLRGGRFERIIDVLLPTPDERKDIIRLYEIGRSFDETWNDEARDDLVRETSGMSGADIEAVVNEAAYAAASTDSESISLANLLGAARRISSTVSARERAIGL